MQTPEKLECRLIPDLLVIPFLLGAVSVGFAVAAPFLAVHPNSDNTLAGLTGAFVVFGLPSIWMFVWYLRARIIADEKGILFQGILRRRFVCWQDIEDYYYQLRPDGNQETRDKALLIVRGKKQSLQPFFKSYDLLLNYVATHATNAAATQWEYKEVRDRGEWPKTFVVRNVSGWHLAGIYLAMTGAFFVLFVLSAMTEINSIFARWETLTSTAKIGHILRFWLPAGLVSLMVFARYPAIRRQRRYRGQYIVATQEGLTLHGAGQNTIIVWDEINSYYWEAVAGFVQPPLRILETAHGRVELSSGLGKMRELQTLIAARAKQAKTTKWGYVLGHDEENLASTLMPEGERRFHYQTRTNRALLLTPSLIILVLLVCPWVVSSINSESSATREAFLWPLVIVCVLLLFPVLFGWYAWFHSYLAIDERGLTQISLWGRRFIPWGDIQSLLNEGYFYTVKSAQTTIRFGAVADGSWLREEIARQAVNAQSQRWQSAPYN